MGKRPPPPEHLVEQARRVLAAPPERFAKEVQAYVRAVEAHYHRG